MSKLSQILDAIDPKTIAVKLVRPCKIAEQTYRAKHLVPKSYEEFLEDCAGYWIHLYSTYHNVPISTASKEYASGMAMMRIDEAFHNQGGTRWAYGKAMEGLTFGIAKSGITEAFVGEIVESYTGWVIRSFVNPYDYKELKELMCEYAKKFNCPVSEANLQIMISSYSMILRSHVKHHADMAFERENGIKA
jgi:hypothetical protein